MVRTLWSELLRMLPRRKYEWQKGFLGLTKGHHWTDAKGERWLYVKAAFRNRIPFLRPPIKSYTMTPAMKSLFGERGESQ